MTTVTPTSTIVRVPGGRFRMGSDDFYPEESPAHLVEVDPFWMDVAPVTNRQFRAFVEATGYVTDAERAPHRSAYPGVRPELLKPGSAVFRRPEEPVPLESLAWWSYVEGACWHQPTGPGSSIEHLLDHPVVHVSHADATAYAAWAGMRLPTEAEWELAARSGLDGAPYAWGDEARPGGAMPANTWPGDQFPLLPAGAPEPGTSPAGAFGANAYGLVDMIGNVWEWTDDFFVGFHTAGGCCVPRNPKGPEAPPEDPLARGGRLRVLKGGSYLCADNYCARYRPAARIPQAEDSGSSNIGFRCVSSERPDPPPLHGKAPR